MLTFLYIARGSAAEVRSLLVLMDRIHSFEERRAELGDLRSRVTDISRQLGGWLESLKNVDHKGPRYQTEATRKKSRDTQRRDSFMEKLRNIVDEAKKNKTRDRIEK